MSWPRSFPTIRKYLKCSSTSPKTGGEKGKAIASELAASAKDEQIGGSARYFGKASISGSKPDVKFTAVDGREIDLQKMNGKVVLVDFGNLVRPLRRRLNVKAAYRKTASQGL